MSRPHSPKYGGIETSGTVFAETPVHAVRVLADVDRRGVGDGGVLKLRPGRTLCDAAKHERWNRHTWRLRFVSLGAIDQAPWHFRAARQSSTLP